MLPIPTRKVFRSRWWALAWSAGICWTAVDVASSYGSDKASNTADNAVTADDDGNAAQVAAILKDF